jgi:hypothetical protein
MNDNTNIQSLPVYKIGDGKLVRKDGDIRDPNRRYSYNFGPEGAYLRELTEEEEHQRNAEEERWATEASQRELEVTRQKTEAEAFRASLKYETRFVTFVDILGWTHAVKASPTDSDRIQKLGIALNTIRQQNQMVEWMLRHSGGNGQPGNQQMTHFSDCVVISTKADLLGKYRLISTLGFLSTSLLHQGFLLRGGVTVGDIYHRESIVFGPAFLKAHELESIYAIYPRIILDPTLAKVWGQGDAYLDKEGRELGRDKTWRLSHDGYCFFDFLQPFSGAPFFAKWPSLIQHSLQPLRTLLVENLSAHKENSSVWPKYAWLANYFNDVCKEHSGHGIEAIAMHD